MFGQLDKLFVLVLASLATISAEPLVDIPYTSLDLAIGRTQGNAQRVAIAIDRVDNLVGDYGELVAAKFSHVILDFEITKDQLEAALAITPEALTMSPDQVLGAFDLGIIALQITAIRDKVYNSTLNQEVSRVTLEEIITEINGCEIVQTNISQQIIDLDDGGNVTGYQPSVRGDLTISQPHMQEESATSQNPCNFASLRNRLQSWIHENPGAARLSALATLTISGIFAFFVLLPLLIYRRLRERNALRFVYDEEYTRIAQYESEMEDEKFGSFEGTNEEQKLLK
ncbi:hypothetical protein K493DRAFT_307512 [Basidiobolus meristosporus CBS 931.73]|uniref:Uncharacterized protein n=1 Tax=Basidiobolus meristosporus CBS 931.73 TaxID=1314790 RepID=A0A1Y1XE63_9FUNG|nr:hypothetical protein K493DRAFT_307512 [Basidiobolus meristosporus CBS 931.73]|eukprot:ORX83997.1 hypothetical protein K493DRAFT_307512 [Basidiobolus meristosporus CBS 931.73]